MIFTSPWFLLLLPLTALPALFHFLLRHRRRPLPFSSLLFFQAAAPHHTRRHRLRERLLLALRMVFIALMILLLSRPVLPGALLARRATSVVVVLDNSASMSGLTPGGATKRSLALDAVRRLVASLDRGTRLGLVLFVDDPEAAVPPGLTIKHEHVLAALERVGTTDATGDPTAALTTALRALETDPEGSRARRALHVFTDLQSTEWSESVAPASDPASPVTTVIHRITTADAEVPNVTFGAVTPPRRRVVPGHTYPVLFELRNTGARPVTVDLHSEDSLGGKWSQRVALDGKGTLPLQVALCPLLPGVQWVRCRIEGDGFNGDNLAYAAVLCDPLGTVLLTGQNADYGLLAHAVAPAGDGRYTSLVPLPVEFDPRDAGADRPPAMVVTTWDRFGTGGDPDEPALRAYVAAGGNLLVLPDATGPAPFERPPAWLGASALPLDESTENAVLAVVDRQSGLWGALRDPTGRVGFRTVTVQRHHPLVCDAVCRVLLRDASGRPVMATRAYGAGNVHLSGLAFDPAWTDLATVQGGVGMLLIQNMALAGGYTDGQRSVGVTAGQSPALSALTNAVQPLASVTGNGDWVSFDSGRPLAFPRVGVFTWRLPEDEACLWVRPAMGEGNTNFLARGQMLVLGDSSYRVEELRDVGFARVTGLGGGFQLFLPLLLGAMLVWATENWVANR